MLGPGGGDREQAHEEFQVQGQLSSSSSNIGHGVELRTLSSLDMY